MSIKTKREELREGLEEFLYKRRFDEPSAGEILSYLHKEGVVFDTGKTILMGETEYTLTEHLLEA